GRAPQPDGEDGGEADRARANDRDGVARADVAGEHADLVPRRQRVGEEDGPLVGDVTLDGVHAPSFRTHPKRLDRPIAANRPCGAPASMEVASTMGRPKLPYVLIVGDIVLSLPAIALGIGFFTVMARSVLDGRMA